MFQKILNIFNKKTFYGSTLNQFDNTFRNWDATQYLQTYADSVYVYSCVRKRAEKVGQIEFKLFKGDKEIEDNEWLNILYRPNQFQSKNEFFEMYQIFKDLAGSTFIYVEMVGKRVVGLHNLRPDWVTINRSKSDGSIVGYTYRKGQKDQMQFKPKEIIASHYPSPLDQSGGHSPVKTGRTTIDTEIQLATYHDNVIKNGGRVEGIISHKVENLTDLQVSQLKKEFEDKYSGARNSGRPLFLYGGFDYKNMGLTPSELSYIDSKKFTREEILMIYGVPLPIIAQGDIGALGSNGYEAALKMFLSETINPLQQNIVQKLNEFFIPDEFRLEYVDQSPDNVELKLKIAESGTKNYYLTQNEIRTLMGYDKIKGGDVILTPFNLTQVQTEEDIQKGVKKKDFSHPLSDKSFRIQYYRDFRKGLQTERTVFKLALRDYFDKQKDRIVERSEKSFMSDRFNIKQEEDIAMKLFLPLLEKTFQEAGQSIYDLFGSDWDFRVRQEPRKVLEERVRFFITEINETTFNQLEDTFESAVKDNLTRAELVEKIKKLYDNRIKDSRAETIARTESHISIELAKHDAYKQLNIPIKIWVHNPVSKEPRAAHKSIDGEEVAMDSRFSNGLLYPGDTSAPAEETINCNCTI